MTVALCKDLVSRHNFTLSISDDEPIVPGRLNQTEVKSKSRIIEKELKIRRHLVTSRKLKCGHFKNSGWRRNFGFLISVHSPGSFEPEILSFIKKSVVLLLRRTGVTQILVIE